MLPALTMFFSVLGRYYILFSRLLFFERRYYWKNFPCLAVSKKKTNLSYLPCIGEKIFKYKQSSDWFCKKGNKRLRYSSRPLGIFSNAAVSFNIFGSRCGHTGLNLSAILIPSHGSAARVGANLERTIIKWENYCLKKNSQHESNNKKNYITRQRPVWVTWSCDGNFSFLYMIFFLFILLLSYHPNCEDEFFFYLSLFI